MRIRSPLPTSFKGLAHSRPTEAPLKLKPDKYTQCQMNCTVT